MKSKTTLTFTINGALIFIFFFSCYQFYVNSIIYDNLPVDVISDPLLRTLKFISVFVIIGLFVAIIQFNFTLRGWNESNFFDLKTIKKFEIQGIILLTLGISLFSLEFTTMTIPSRKFLPAGFLGMGISGSILLFCIGLLFNFVALIITIAKRLKDENDLTI